MSNSASTSEVIQVVESDGIYLLRIDYDDGGSGQAVGHVFWTADTRVLGSTPELVLSTNDELRVMWCSPEGNLWVGSALGRIATTAPMTGGPVEAGIQYAGNARRPRWSVARLPPLAASGLPPNITALWGFSDAQVFAGTYGGHVYRWDGVAWSSDWQGDDRGRGTINAFGGGPNDVFAVGSHGNVLHFDGNAWRRVSVVTPDDSIDNVTGIVYDAERGTTLSLTGGTGSRLLHGGAQGFTDVGQFPDFFLHMAALGDRVLLLTTMGVSELLGNQVNVLKAGVKAASISIGHGRAFFIELDQRPTPRFIEYAPQRKDAPWWRTTI